MVFRRAGERSKKLTLQLVTYTQDAYGAAVPTWTTVGYLWGGIHPVASRELALARSHADTVSHRVIIDYRADVSPKHNRFLFGSRMFTVDGAIDTEEKNVELICYCTEALT